MASSLSLSLTRFLCLSIAAPSLFATLSAAAPWIVTANYEEIVTVYTDYTEVYGGYTYTEPAETDTDIETVTSPSGSAISTATITETDYYSDDIVTIVEVLYPHNAAATATSNLYATTTTYNEYLYTNFYVTLAYTAPTACSSSWTYTTAAEVYPPDDVEDALVPTSVSTSYSTDNSSPFQPTVWTQVNAYVDPSQVPASSMSMLTEEYSPYPSCYNPSQTATDSSASSTSTSFSSSDDGDGIVCNYYFCYYSGDDNGGSWINDSSMYGISPLAIILITVLGWTFLLFVVGLFENYFHFQRLMKGWQARRGVPVTWLLWAFPLTCIVCCWFSRRGFQARSEEDAAELRKQWQERGFWNKKKVWLRYGFTVGYPAVLQGPAPPRVGRPSKKPTKPLLQVTPPPTETADVSRELTPRSDGGNLDVENAAAAPPLPQREMSGGLPVIATTPPLTTVVEDETTEVPGVPTTTHSHQAQEEITEVPDVPTTTHTHQAEEAAQKQVSEKGE